MIYEARGLIGLAQRAGRCVSGAELAERALREGTAKLILLDEAASGHTVDHFRSIADGVNVPFLFVPNLGEMIGKEGRRVCAVNDEGFARAILKKTGETAINPGV